MGERFDETMPLDDSVVMATLSLPDKFPNYICIYFGKSNSKLALLIVLTFIFISKPSVRNGRIYGVSKIGDLLYVSETLKFFHGMNILHH
jgi:hypothetical protein